MDKYPVLTEAVYYILLSLNKPFHGYGIMRNIENMSEGSIKLAPGTLYGALNTLLEKGWIKQVESVENNRKKEYVITETGIEVMKAEIYRLEKHLNNGRKIIGDEDEKI